jgi:indole-3-glycerol phosphate synthase
MSILEKIAAYKREEVSAAKKALPISQLEEILKTTEPPRGFRRALERKRQVGQYGLIAEIKKASPSKGLIRADFDPSAIANAYGQGGATCLSVLTDTPSFQGRLAYLQSVRASTNLPLLRKDFMLDPYQVAEARAYGADCILLILAMTDDTLNRELLAAAERYGMDTLVEVHDTHELERALPLGAEMIGINNRDLKTFHTDLNVTLRLAPQIPSDVLVVAESGINTHDDLKRLQQAGVSTFLVGESLMRQSDIAAATRALLGIE